MRSATRTVHSRLRIKYIHLLSILKTANSKFRDLHHRIICRYTCRTRIGSPENFTRNSTIDQYLLLSMARALLWFTQAPTRRFSKMDYTYYIIFHRARDKYKIVPFQTTRPFIITHFETFLCGREIYKIFRLPKHKHPFSRSKLASKNKHRQLNFMNM